MGFSFLVPVWCHFHPRAHLVAVFQTNPKIDFACFPKYLGVFLVSHIPEF